MEKWSHTHNFPSTPLIFKLPQEVLKFNDISVSWSSAKNELEVNFLNLENGSFKNVKFFPIVTFKYIFDTLLLIINLFIF